MGSQRGSVQRRKHPCRRFRRVPSPTGDESPCKSPPVGKPPPCKPAHSSATRISDTNCTNCHEISYGLPKPLNPLVQISEIRVWNLCLSGCIVQFRIEPYPGKFPITPHRHTCDLEHFGYLVVVEPAKK